MKHLCLLLAALLSFAVTAFSQPPDTLWTRTVATEWLGEARAVCLTQDSGYAVAGICCGWFFHTVYYSAFVAKLDRSGQIVWLWQDHWGSMISNGAHDVIETPDGGLVAVGNSSLFGGDADLGLWAVRLNAQGDTVWNRTGFGDLLSCGGRAVCLAPGGGYLIAGAGSTSLCKLDSSGNLLWQRTWGISFEDMTPTQDGNFVCVGRSESGGSHCLMVKVTPSGDSLWLRDCDTGYSEEVHGVIATADGGLAICGSGHFPSGPSDMFLALKDSSGNYLMTRCYEHSLSFAMDLCQTRDGGFVLVGGFPSDEETADSTQIIVVRTRPNADVEWVKIWGSDGYDYGRSVLQDTDSGYVVAGSWSPEAWYVAKLAADPLSVSERGAALTPEHVSLSSFPNPFNPSTTISFSLPREARARIAVFDVLGREVAMLADNVFTAGEHRIMFDGSSLPSGLYFARLQSGNTQTTHKLLLMK